MEWRSGFQQKLAISILKRNPENIMMQNICNQS